MDRFSVIEVHYKIITFTSITHKVNIQECSSEEHIASMKKEPKMEV